MGARENILRRIRAAQGRSGEAPTAPEMDRVRADIARRAAGPLPPFGHTADPMAQFLKECDRLSTTHASVEIEADVPREVARYLGANLLAPTLVGWESFRGFDWQGAGVVFEPRVATGSDATGITGCFCAIAETGTVLLLSSSAQPKLTALLPETHICVVRRSRLVNTMEDAFALMRAEVGEPPRATFFVSGPSRTADIEQTIVIGAHGPYRVHVIVVS